MRQAWRLGPFIDALQVACLSWPELTSDERARWIKTTIDRLPSPLTHLERLVVDATAAEMMRRGSPYANSAQVCDVIAKSSGFLHAQPRPPLRTRLVSNARPVISDGARRLADVLGRIVSADVDPRTITMAARAGGISASSFKALCRRVQLSPQRVRDFARLARATIRSTVYGDSVLSWLDVGDDRTLRALVGRAGLTIDDAATLSIESFIVSQAFIHPRHPVVRGFSELVVRQADVKTGNESDPKT